MRPGRRRAGRRGRAVTPPKRLVTRTELRDAGRLPEFEFLPVAEGDAPPPLPPPLPRPDDVERAELLLELVTLAKAMVDPTTTLYEEAIAKDAVRRILQRLG